MLRPQHTIAWSMIAIAVIGYFCAFPELAVLLGIFASAVLFVSPVALLIYLVCRCSSGARSGELPASPGDVGGIAVEDAEPGTATAHGTDRGAPPSRRVTFRLH